MGDELRDYSEFADPPLRLPVKGKVYELPEIGIADGLRLSGVLTGSNTEFAGRPGEDLWALVCGPVWQQMIDDGCSYKVAARVGYTALVDFELGRDAAKAFWEGDGEEGDDGPPEAPAGQSPAPGPETPPTTPPAEGSMTPSPAAGAGTSTPPESTPPPPLT